jgi:hypothetical protein
MIGLKERTSDEALGGVEEGRGLRSRSGVAGVVVQFEREGLRCGRETMQKGDWIGAEFHAPREKRRVQTKRASRASRAPKAWSRLARSAVRLHRPGPAQGRRDTKLPSWKKAQFHPNHPPKHRNSTLARDGPKTCTKTCPRMAPALLSSHKPQPLAVFRHVTPRIPLMKALC